MYVQVLWKSYIDFEIELEEYDNTRKLYELLLERTRHIKVRRSLLSYSDLCVQVPHLLIFIVVKKYVVLNGDVISATITHMELQNCFYRGSSMIFYQYECFILSN